MRWHRRTAFAVVAAAVVAGAGGVAVAASTHTLPLAAGGDEAPSPAAASHVPPTPPGARTADPAAPGTPNRPDGQGPDASGPAKFGLCTTFASGRGGTNGNKLDSVAFQALATAAGGSANIAAFCADATPSGNTHHRGGTPPVSTPVGGPANADATGHANPASDAHGPPSDPGSNGQSHRP